MQFIGTVPGWLTLISVTCLAFVLLRGGTGTAVSGLQDTNRELVRQVHELKDENSELRSRVRVLESKTDISEAVQPLVTAMQTHEAEAAKRSTATLILLDMIATKLGTEQ